MSFLRFVYYSAIFGGWAAFFGWLFSELLLGSSIAEGGTVVVAAVGGLVGGAIGLGLSIVAGMSNGQLKQLILRSVPGLLGGAVGGAVGGLVGNAVYSVGMPFALGWIVVGVGVGIIDGLYEKSAAKIRNGLIGGAIGGLIGGLSFDPIQRALASDSGMSSRAVAFVILGLSIGAAVGLTQVVFKQAWLSVVEGYRPGRQLILSSAVTTIGRGDHLPLPFMGSANQSLELEHCRIVRQANGRFLVEDNRSQLGTKINGTMLDGSRALSDGDVICIGTNLIRFNERRGKSEGASGTGTPHAAPPVPPPPPMPPPPPAPAVRKPGVAVSPTDTKATAGVAPSAPKPAVSSTKPNLPPPPPPPKRK